LLKIFVCLVNANEVMLETTDEVVG